MPAPTARAQHAQIEAMKLAFADIYRYVAEPGSMPLSAADLLAPDYLAERARLIDPRRAQVFGPGNPMKGGGHLSDSRRRGRDDGQLHPEQLHGLWLGAGRAHLRRVAAEPWPRLLARPAPSESLSRRASGPSTHHPGVPHQSRVRQ